LGYAVTLVGLNGQETWHVSAIINCAWQNIEYFSKQLGLYTPDENRVIRVKVCLRVKLPESLKNVNTCIFSIGPFVSITNLGNGEAVLASEATTNVGYYKAGTHNLPSSLTEIVKGKLSHKEGKGAMLAGKILRECTRYLPDLAQSEILKIMVGHVKMIRLSTPYKGLSSLYQQDSPIHQRLERGVEAASGAIGYIANSGNKMTYTLHNAQEVCRILDHHFRLMNNFSQLLSHIKPRIVDELRKLGKNFEQHLTDPFLFSICKRAFLSGSSTSYPEVVLQDILAVIHRKEIVLSLIRNSFIRKPVVEKITGSENNTLNLRAKL